jgi:hypothetical protein
MGFVDDLGALYDWSSVVLAPATSGGGSQLKVSEANARGRVVVGPTYLSAELRNSPDLPEGAIRASADLAETIVELWRSPTELTLAHRRLIDARSRFTWQNRLAPLVDSVRNLLT